MYPEGWAEASGFLTKVFVFDGFVEAVRFVDSIVPVAEEIDHHPDIEIFSYKKVRVKLVTHDQGNKITFKDLELARKIDLILKK